MVRILVIVVVCLSLSGCLFGRQYLANEQAKIVEMYRKCLEKYQDDPVKAKTNCEHYTQALQAIDVRGLK
jgi:hypothetical protein